VGTEHRQQYLTELEAAEASDRTRRRLSLPRNTALDGAGRIRQLVMKFVSAGERAIRRSNKLGDAWTPSLDEQRGVLAVASAYEKAVAAEERLRKMLTAERKDYSEAEFQLVWKRELKLAATETLTADDWWDLLRIGFGDDTARVIIRARYGEQVLATLEGS
jgi:hypothetical protein